MNEKEMNKFKLEYVTIIDEIDKLLIKFKKMEENTAKLKEFYAKNPKDEKVLQEIKETEALYQNVYEQFVILNKRAKALKEMIGEQNENCRRETGQL